MHLTRLPICLPAVLAIGMSSLAQTLVPQPQPYEADEHTVLLQHFDGATTGTANGSVEYGSGVFGSSIKLNSSSWISWPLGGLPDGTVEFWTRLDDLENGIGVPHLLWAYLSANQIGGGPGSTLIVNVAGEGDHVGMPSAGVNISPFNWLHTDANTVRIKPGVWHHYALTWGSKGLHFYVDGRLIGTNSSGGLNSATTVWLVGNSNGHGFNGMLDELRISNVQRSFSPREAGRLSIEVASIRLSWATPKGIVYDLQYSTDFATWKSLATVVGTGAVASIVEEVRAERRYYRLLETRSLGSGLVGYFPFNGNATDESGSGNDANLVNGTEFGANRFQQGERAALFRAHNRFVQTSTSNGFPIEKEDFTISMWVNAATENLTVGDGHGMLFSNLAADELQLDLYWQPEQKVQLQFHTGGMKFQGPADCTSPPLDWNINQWYNVQVVRSANQITIYRDGTIVGQAQTIQGNDAPPHLRNLQFGFRTPNSGHQFYGSLDDIRIYNRALPQVELDAIRILEE